jgi:hypothetical protein
VDGWRTELEAAVVALERVVAGLRAERLDGDAAVVSLGLLARATKVAEAGQALVAGVIDASGAHQRRGHRSAAELVAATAGVEMSRAATTVEVARRLADQPVLEDAFRRGSLSLDQAGLISEALAAAPEHEHELIEVAANETVRTLRRRAREVRLAAEADRETIYARQRACREFRTWRDARGMVRGTFALPPDHGVSVVNRIERETDRLYRAADRETRRATTHAQFGADALVTVVTGEAPSSTRAAEIVVHVSHSALGRGDVGDGELCRTEAGDDLPVGVVHQLLDDAFVKAVVVDGNEVRTVKHFGRRIPAAVRTALHAEAMLRHGEVRCSVAGCDRTAGLQWHHVEPHARGGQTSLQNLEPRCPHDHRREHAGLRERPPP